MVAVGEKEAGCTDRAVWQDRARAAGADGAELVAAGAVGVADWVRLKCRYGCPDYGRRLSCAPHAPGPDEFRPVLAGYEQALLVWVEGRGTEAATPARRRLAEALLALERDAFLARCHKAFALSDGPCLWCDDEPCPPDGTCRHRDRLRPAMSACGIDAFATASAAGVPLQVAGDEQAAFRLLGLLLIA